MASLIKRKGTFYLQWRVGGKIRRRSLHTPVLQLAREKLRQFQSAQHRGGLQARGAPLVPPGASE